MEAIALRTHRPKTPQNQNTISKIQSFSSFHHSHPHGFHLKQYAIMPKSLPLKGIQRGLQLKLSFGRREQCVLMAKCKGSDGEVGKESEGEGEGGGEGGEGLTYKEAGVDIDAGAELVKRIAKMADGIGGFGGLFPLGDSYLIAGTDGVGTKLKLAFETGMHDTIGIDLVAMSVNDIVTSGAKPLFFLDYFATSRLDVDLAERVIKGIVNGCQQSDCVLLGGETAEMPDFYKDGEYDLSGFAVGIVKKDSVIDGKNIEPGDVLIGLPSGGVHSNGFSLVRRVLQKSGLSLNDKLPGQSTSLGEALMAPTVIYVKQVLDIISRGGVKGIAHITGGGFTDNIPRVFPKGMEAHINTGSWPILPVFKWIQETGKIDNAEMMRTFNMGIGMVLVVSQETAIRILAEGNEANPVYRIGEVVDGEGVTYQ